MEAITKKIWFITGVSSGLGKALAQSVIERGDFVIGTFRIQQQVDDFNRQYDSKARGMLLDVTHSEAIEQVFEQIKTEFGRLDVLVNNAGIGYIGAVEEATLEEAKTVFEVNVFGALKVTQVALPIMRAQRSGHIFQISSGSGIKASAGFGIYNASKFALEGFSEALADEIAPLGIKLTLVEPGPFRTEFAGSSLHQSKINIEDYASTAGVFKKRLTEMVNGHQEGDPRKAAEIIINVANSVNPPLRLPLGKMVLSNIEAKLNSVKNDLEVWREVAASAVY